MPTEQPDGNIRDLKDFKDIQRACCKDIPLSLVAHKGPADTYMFFVVAFCFDFLIEVMVFCRISAGPLRATRLRGISFATCTLDILFNPSNPVILPSG